MARPIPPPRGYFIPTRMIFASQMPPAVFVTWLQLRCLTWGGQTIPPFSFDEWADLTGTSRTTLIRHLDWLKGRIALHWYHPERGKVSVSFTGAVLDAGLPGKPVDRDGIFRRNSFTKRGREETDRPKMDRLKMDRSKIDTPPSLKSHPSMSGKQLGESGYQGSVDIQGDEGEGEFEGERGENNHPASQADPASIYRQMVHLTPNQAQRRILAEKVHDLPQWQLTLEHWLGHGWNPRNLTGMLELYQRGGPDGCRYCHRAARPTPKAETPLQRSLAAIEALRQELDKPPDHIA